MGFQKNRHSAEIAAGLSPRGRRQPLVAIGRRSRAARNCQAISTRALGGRPLSLDPQAIRLSRELAKATHAGMAFSSDALITDRLGFA